MPIKKVIAVTSGKGGTGKSTFSVNLALAAVSPENPVLIIDMDAGMRCLDLLLGVSDEVLMDVSDVLSGRDLENAIIPVKKEAGLYLLPAPTSFDRPDSKAFSNLVCEALQKFSLVIIDFPAGSDFALYEKLPVETEFICICNPDPVSIRDAALCGTKLRTMGKNGLLVINKYSLKYISNQSFRTLDDIINETGLRLIGIVPLSAELATAFLTGNFKKRGNAAKAFKRISARLGGKNIPLPKLKKI